MTAASAWGLDHDPGDWRHRAVCRDEDPELFFPIGSTGPAARQIEEAKAVCRTCPVAADCLGFALDTGQVAGVWDGMSEDERRALGPATEPRPRTPVLVEPEDIDRMTLVEAARMVRAMYRAGQPIPPRLAAMANQARNERKRRARECAA